MIAAAILIHAAACILVTVLVETGRLAWKRYVLPFVYFVPFWGILCVFILQRALSKQTAGRQRIPMEKLKVDDVVYKSIAPENVQEKSVAPLEDVLMFSPAVQRRGVMLDILQNRPDSYAGVLMQARSGDDTEVVHYATTAMAEMSKQYDLEIQHYESEYAKNPEDAELIREYADCLEAYLQSGFAEGRTAEIQRRQQVKLLQKLSSLSPDFETEEKLCAALIAEKNYTLALEQAEKMVRDFPKREEPRLRLIEIHAMLRDGRKVRECIRKAREDGVYFGKSGEEQIRFFSGEPETNA